MQNVNNLTITSMTTISADILRVIQEQKAEQLAFQAQFQQQLTQQSTTLANTPLRKCKKRK